MVQLFLVSGQLVPYHITPKTTLHRKQFKVINLLDAYVCSGYFAAQTLPKGQYSPNAPATPRRYQDGLETDDPEEDTLFTVWYRPHAPVVDVAVGRPTANIALSRVPSLASKRKLVVFRTRSKLERDAWCWALNCEIDKMVRLTQAREEKLRECGLVKL
jgi:Pleckstrin homology domain